MAETDTTDEVIEQIVESRPGATVAEPASDSPSQAGAVAPAPPPSAEDLLQREREARIRAEAEADTLRRVAATKPAETPTQKVYTPEEVEQLYAEQRITDAQRIGYYADLRYHERRAEERKADMRQRADTARGRANEQIGIYLGDYPELNQSDSPLRKKVNEELGALAEDGFDTTDPRMQVRAIKAVVGGHRLGGGNGVETTFRRRPAGSGGGGPVTTETTAKPKSRGEQLWARMTPDGQDSYLHVRGSKEAAIKTLEHATDASIKLMEKAGRFQS